MDIGWNHTIHVDAKRSSFVEELVRVTLKRLLRVMCRRSRNSSQYGGEEQNEKSHFRAGKEVKFGFDHNLRLPTPMEQQPFVLATHGVPLKAEHRKLRFD